MSTFKNLENHPVPVVVGEEVVMVPPGGEVSLHRAVPATPPPVIPDFLPEQTQPPVHAAVETVAERAAEDEDRKSATNKRFKAKEATQ